MKLVIWFLSVLLSEAVYGYGHTKLREKRSYSGFDYDDYNKYDDINRELVRLQNYRPNRVKIIEIGRTHENRAMNVVKISGDRPRKGNVVSMWIDAGIHAREWISVSTAMIFIQELVYFYDYDSAIHELLNSVDFYILPMANPDGYEYTHTKERCWRKNRRPTKCYFDGFNSTCCTGVDLNRNYDWYWGTKRSGPPCSRTYPGPFPASEPETRAIMDFLHKNPVHAAVTMHSCSQFMLIPFAHKNETYSPNYQKEKDLAQRAADALYGEYGRKYNIGTTAELLYETSGNSADWMKGKLGIPYTYTFELRNACNDDRESTCENNFILPKTSIRPTGLETFEAIKVIAAEMAKLYG